MVKAWFVILFMFVGTLAGFLTWFADYARYRSFRNEGHSVMATPVAKSQKPGRTIMVFDDVRQEYPVRFRTEAGQEVATIAYVPQSFIDQVKREGSAELIYLPDEPQRMIFPGDLERIPSNYGSLAFAAACFIVGVLLIRVRYRLMRYLSPLAFAEGAHTGESP